MKFLIQKVNGEVKHDFAFTLLKAIEFHNWLHKEEVMKVKFLDYIEVSEPDDIYPLQFKPFHKDYIPIGSVEFVTEFLGHFYGLTPKPINIPNELLSYEFTKRFVFNGSDKEVVGKKFIKSNDKIKGYADIVDDMFDIPEGNYQISDVISIDSEWRAFVYQNRLVGLYNYCGEFTKFPNVGKIKEMIAAYKNAPVAYTLDIGVCDEHTYADDIGTVVIECHDFFSCGLYGFADLAILPYMFQRWIFHYIRGIEYKKIHKTITL